LKDATKENNENRKQLDNQLDAKHQLRLSLAKINGQVPSTRDIKFIVGYVEQSDTLVGELTVEDMLRYTTELKLPSDTLEADRMARVE
jgi:hypothetical protein